MFHAEQKVAPLTQNDNAAIDFSYPEIRTTGSFFYKINFGSLLPIATLSIFILAFGGIHSVFFLSGELVLYLALLCFCVSRGRAEIRQLYLGIPKYVQSRPITTLAVASFLWMMFLALSDWTATTPLPLLDSNIGHASNAASIDSLRWIGFLFVALLAFRTSISRRRRNMYLLFFAIGTVTAFISISHWLHDNGKLFWLFAPEHILVSSRARWPFVNPNHLAHILIPAVFIGAVAIRLQFHKIIQFARDYPPARKNGFVRLFESRRFQRKVFMLLIELIGILGIAVALSGTLSRAAWLSCSFGIIVLIFLDRFVVKTAKIEPSGDSIKKLSKTRRFQQNRIHGRHQGIRIPSGMSRLVRPLFFIASLVIFLVFLNERGQELVENRLEYGLLYSLEDIRWQMYRDTLPLISKHLWLGVGLGNWEPFFKSAMNPLLAGINPVFLHSDPLQFLAETGLVGTLPIVCALLLTTFFTFRKIRSSEFEQGEKLAALLVGLWCALIASCFDFPFRIPAIALQFVLLWALLCSEVEDEEPAEARVLRRHNHALDEAIVDPVLN